MWELGLGIGRGEQENWEPEKRGAASPREGEVENEGRRQLPVSLGNKAWGPTCFCRGKNN